MQKSLAARGQAWPQFRDNDVPDLIAYIRTLAPNPRARVYLRPADPEAGRRVFQQKGCSNCHAVRGVGGRSAPDLGRHTLPRTLGQFAGLMWNHAPAMRASMQAQQVARPQFSNKEMADLIAYLFVERYFEISGNAERGRRVFADKGCAGCHRIGGRGVGPDLTRARVSLLPMATAMWNHGPMMLKTMREQQIAWPQFQPGEIVDLMDYLYLAQPAAAETRGKP